MAFYINYIYGLTNLLGVDVGGEMPLSQLKRCAMTHFSSVLLLLILNGTYSDQSHISKKKVLRSFCAPIYSYYKV